VGGWSKLRPTDARQLANVLATFNDSRNATVRQHMLLYCFSQLQSSGKPCQYFTCGMRTIARECGTTFATARAFMDAMERDGIIVRLRHGNNAGKYVRRTFWWLAEEAGCAVETTHPAIDSQRETTRWCAVTQGSNDTHQSTEYSEIDASRPSASAEALASDADRWYVENGLPVPRIPRISNGDNE